MLRTAQQLRNVITVYHNPSLKASQDFVSLLHKRFPDTNKLKCELQIEESNPTQEQLATMKSLTPLLANVKEPEDLPKPTLVSWFNGKVAVANPERANAILNLVEHPNNRE